MLTKTDYLAFTQCPKQFWLEKFASDLGAPPDPAALRRLQMGQEIDVEARKQFPDGVLIPYRPNPEDMVPLTLNAIANGATTLFQATLVANDLLIKADIMTLTADGWHLLEVKSSTKVKPEHLPDAAYQHFVVEQAGLDVAGVSVMHITKGTSADDSANLFTLSDVSADSATRQPQVAADIETMRHLVRASAAPAQQIGRFCTKPFACPFVDHCWQHVDGLTIYDIPRLNRKKEQPLELAGVINIRDIPIENDLTDTQQRFVDRFNNNEITIDKAAITAELDQLTYPLYFFDFETIDYAIPRFDNSIVYQQVPFQFSCHILHRSGDIEHVEFLHTDQTDPRPSCIDSLCETMGTEGSVIAYYIPFERGRLRELADFSPAHADRMHNIIDRLWDQLDIFKKYYQHYAFGPSNSLKSVLPVVVPALSYKTLEVQNGTAAQVVWEKVVAMEESAEKQALADQLLAYCHLDTLAMVRIHQHLQSL